MRAIPDARPATQGLSIAHHSGTSNAEPHAVWYVSMEYARAYTCAVIYHTRKAPIVAVSLTVIEVAKFCVAKNKRDKRFLYVICTRRFAHIGLRDDMQLQNYEK